MVESLENRSSQERPRIENTIISASLAKIAEADNKWLIEIDKEDLSLPGIDSEDPYNPQTFLSGIARAVIERRVRFGKAVNDYALVLLRSWGIYYGLRVMAVHYHLGLKDLLKPPQQLVQDYFLQVQPRCDFDELEYFGQFGGLMGSGMRRFQELGRTAFGIGWEINRLTKLQNYMLRVYCSSSLARSLYDEEPPKKISYLDELVAIRDQAEGLSFGQGDPLMRLASNIDEALLLMNGQLFPVQGTRVEFPGKGILL